MATSFYRFGAFRVDLQARELFERGRRVDLPLSTVDCLIHLIRHRDRPVGRDELAAAVWGRADVSEVSLTHAIMRLRRVLGDDGNAQRCIRTVPRHGYRWVAADTVEEHAAAPPDGEAPAAPAAEADAPAPHAQAGRAAPRSALRRAATALGLALALLALAAAGLALHRRAARAPVAAAESALVLPVALDAGEDASWMRLGLMDLIATQLRRGGLPTPPSASVVALLDARRFADEAEARSVLPATWLVRTRATLAHERWNVQLRALADGRTLDVDTQDGDAVRAARRAADELLIRLGRTPPQDDGGDAALAAATLRQRISAAVLSNQLDVARALIERAPAALQASPEIALGRLRVAFHAGDYEGSRAQAQALLAALPTDAAPELRARVLNALGSALFRLGRFDDAAQAFAGTERLLRENGDPGVLADAYRGSGSVASDSGRFEQAADAYGRARTLYELANDPFGIATIDLDLAINAMQRGRPGSAVPLLEQVRERFVRFAAADALAATEVSLVEAQLAMLDHSGALATSAAFVSPQSDAGNPRRRWQLMFARAAALAGVGRLGEAEMLLARLRDGSEPGADAIARALADRLGAEIALARGEPERAAALAAAAQTAELERRNREQYAAAALTQVRALQQSGALPAAAAAIARLRAWNAAAPDAATALGLALAEAQQAGAEGRTDLALQRYAEAMAQAGTRAIPEEMVQVGLPYVRALLAAGRRDEAVAVNGRIAAWADRDLRAAWSEALVYAALGRRDAAAKALERARQLAGERTLVDRVAALR